MENKDAGILVVDDELSVRDSLYNWFREDGYRVDTAKDAKKALKKLQESTWDIVLLDIKMPIEFWGQPTWTCTSPSSLLFLVRLSSTVRQPWSPSTD